MGSPVTLSGFNNIDFSVVLNAVMQRERQPVTLLEQQQTALTAQKTLFSTLASKLSALQSAAEEFTRESAYGATSATVSDETRLTVNSASSAPEGTYRMTVSSLARAQVRLMSASGSSTGFTDKDQTIVATGGTLSFGTDRTITITGGVTLEGLATAINDADVGVFASVVQNTTGYHLMLTGEETGAANAFTVTNSLQGGAAAGRAATSKQTAADAQIVMNGVTITSTTNTFDGVIPETSFTVLKEDAANPVIVTITASDESLKALVQKIVTAFNDTVSFLSEQQKAASGSQADSIGRDPLVRSLRREITSAILADSSGGGVYSSLAQLGFTISRSGELSLDEAKLTAALTEHKEDVQALFFGTNGSDGVFGRFESAIETFTRAGGLLPNAQERLSDQASKIADRIADMEERLEIKRAALQRQFAAADAIIAQLNQQGSQIGQMSNSWY